MGQIGTRAVAWPANQFAEVTRGDATVFRAADLDDVGSGATGYVWDFATARSQVES